MDILIFSIVFFVLGYCLRLALDYGWHQKFLDEHPGVRKHIHRLHGRTK